MSTGRRQKKKQPAGTTAIVREQIQLVKAEKEIQEALKQIGQYRNRLVVSVSARRLATAVHSLQGHDHKEAFGSQVEELELKAQLSRNTNQSVTPKVEPANMYANYNKPDIINARSINVHVANPDEEFDSD